MNSWRFLAALIFFYLPTASAECLLTFNTYGPLYAPRVYERTQQMIKEIHENHLCDVIHFQEAWNGTQINQIEKGFSSHYKIYSPNRNSRIGIMSLSRNEWISADVFTFRINYDGGFLDGARRISGTKKAFTVVKGALPDTWTINTHLHPSSTPVRVTQILDLLNWRLNNQEGSIFASGDFNFAPKSFEHRFFRKIIGMEDTIMEAWGEYPEGFCTYCTDNPLGWLNEDQVFDYVFISRRNGQRPGWKITSAELVFKNDKYYLSDHYGIRIHFESSNEKSFSLAFVESHQELIDLLTQAEAQLLNFGGVDSYIEQLRRMKSEVKNQSGPYWDYFSKIL